MHTMLRLLALLAAVMAFTPAARAVESAAVRSPRATVTLIADQAAIAPGQAFRVALRQRLAPGWHTYWINPGDAGQPPEVTFALPDGASAGAMRFPAPQRIPFGPLVNFGYEGEAVFTIPVTAPASLRPGETFTLAADATWLVCEQVCIPEEGAFRLDIPVEAAPRPDPATGPIFTAAEAAEPRAGPFTARAGFDGLQGAVELAGPAITAGAVREAFFFPLAVNLLDNAASQPLTVRDGTLRLGLTRGRADDALPASVEGVVAITDAAGVRGAYLVSAPPGPVPAAGGLPLWQALLFAALGGLILNLMPCVFPILAMKAVALARLSGAARGAVRAHAASYTAGVVLSFLALGGVMIGLRAAGGAAGWGFQFTSPVFVGAMAWLMLAVGLNLSGVYAVGGPVAAGGALAGRGGHAGSFFTGALAVLVATPCTAPFMAAAIGAALGLGAIEALAVFGAMGLGMALPYALLGLAPGLARLLPKPGVWMDRLKQGLAFPMYGAAAWLVWVLAEQAGPPAVLLVLMGAVLIGFAAWAVGLAQGSGGRMGRLAGGVALVGALALLPVLHAAPTPAQAAETTGEAWSTDRLAALRAEGRPVFVNLTAAWCITCKVNERLALSSAGVRQAFEQRGITTLVGDWTRGDPAITAVLRAHGRDGVPLYLFYPAGATAPRILPQILTEGIVLEAISASGAAGS
jgi:thiol:disulfide interchange protein DsbD